MRHLTLIGVSVLAASIVAAPGAVSAQTTQSTKDKVEQKTEQTKDKAEQKAEQAKDKTKSATESAKTGMSDSWITAKTKMALYADERVSGTSVNVDTKSGVVTLRGKVDTADAKSAAESVAKSIEGVKSVKNDLQVVAPGQRKAVDASDKEIIDAVKKRMAADPQLKKVDVRADRGVVTLTGETPTATAAAKASEVARQVPGVRSVKNETTFERRGEVRSDDLRADRRDVRAERPMQRERLAATNGRSDEVRGMQEALKERGYDPGPIDGMMGPRTASALREYQKAEKLNVTGRMDAETVSSLKAAPKQRQAR